MSMEEHAADLLAHRRSVACRIAHAIEGHPAVSALLVFGSVASGHVDERSDVDLFVICAPDVIPLEERKAPLTQIGTGWRFGDQSQANPLFATYDADGQVDEIFTSLHYQTVAWIETVLRQVLEQGAITTEQMPFRPYTLPALLLRGWLLSDHDGIVARWREQARPFPRRLKRNILSHFAPLLQEQTEELIASAQRHLGPRAFIFHLNWAVDALTSILFALNDLYDPADRRAEQTILPTLARVPQDFLPRLAAILEGPFDAQGALHRARLFQHLAAEALKMAEAEMA